MTGHFILKCKKCKKVMAQCRCMSKDKDEKYSTCDSCKEKENNMKDLYLMREDRVTCLETSKKIAAAGDDLGAISASMYIWIKDSNGKWVIELASPYLYNFEHYNAFLLTELLDIKKAIAGIQKLLVEKEK